MSPKWTVNLTTALNSFDSVNQTLQKQKKSKDLLIGMRCDAKVHVGKNNLEESFI